MSERVGVFVVSIEAYPAAPGLALRDAHADAAAFLAAVRMLHPTADVAWCASPAAPGSTHGATRAEIVAAIEAKLTGPLGWRAGGLDRLYAFVSAHGVSVRVSAGEVVQALVTAERAHDDDGALLSIDELQDRLAGSIGPGAHHWFSDVCRVDLDEIAAPLTGVLFSARPVRPAWRSWVWSTAPRTLAASRSGFGAAVARALEGDARRWSGEADPSVRHLTLSNRAVGDYVATRVKDVVPGQDVVEGHRGDADELRRYDPAPTRALRLLAPADKTVRVTLHGGRGGLPTTVSARGETVVQLPVDHYTMQVGIRWAPVPLTVDLLSLAEPPAVEIVARSTPAPAAPDALPLRLDALHRTRLVLPRVRALDTPLARTWRGVLDGPPSPADHLSESLTGVPVELDDVDDGVTLAAVAAALDGGFHILRRGGFPALGPADTGVYVVWSGAGDEVPGAAARVEAADGGWSGAAEPLRAGGVAPAVFLPVPDAVQAGGPGFVRVRLLPTDGPERVVLVPVGRDAVTVLHVIDQPGAADLRVVVAPRTVPADQSMRVAGWQLVAQRVVREGRTARRGESLPEPAALPLPPGDRAREVYGALLHRAHRFDASLPAHPPGEERWPPWLCSGWNAREADSDAALAALAAWTPRGIRFFRSPLTTWIVPPPPGGAP